MAVTIFEIKHKMNIFHRVWNELYLLLFFNVLALLNIPFFNSNYLIIEICVLALLLYRLFNKSDRQVYKLLINDDGEFLSVFYFYFIILKFEKKIYFKSLQVNYNYKRYARGKIPKTLEIKRDNILIAEIRQKYNLGWTSEELDEIYDKIEKVIAK